MVSAIYNPTVQALTANGYVVATNKNSGVEEFTKGLDTVVSITNAVRDSEVGSFIDFEKFALIGHSMGGRTAGWGSSNEAEAKSDIFKNLKASVAIQPAYLHPIPEGGQKPSGTSSLWNNLIDMQKGFGGFIVPDKAIVTTKPTLFLGGNQKEWGDGENPRLSYEVATGPKFVAIDHKASHVLGMNAKGYLESAREFMKCFVDGISASCEKFSGPSPQICADSTLGLEECRGSNIGLSNGGGNSGSVVSPPMQSEPGESRTSQSEPTNPGCTCTRAGQFGKVTCHGDGTQREEERKCGGMLKIPVVEKE